MGKPIRGKARLIRAIVMTTAIVFMGIVVVRSFQIPGFECDACMEFRNMSVCRTVQAATEAEARSGAINNACALISSGVTDTLACERSTPTKLECRVSE